MASPPAVLKIDIIADASKAAKAMDQTANKAGGLKGKLSGIAKGAAAGFAVGAVVAFGKSAVSAAEESRQATERLDAVFKAVGDTTGTAAKAAEDYAGSMSKKTGIDDEAIMKAQAMLGTFAAVSNETARGAGIFDRATAAAGDLAAAGFGSLDGNAVQLGKALQDPTKGLAALGRSGVTFTKAQKEQIATMQKHGDLLGAQKTVLAAVEGQVKGTAEATATSSDKMNLAFGNTQEAIGGALLPVLDALAPVLESVAGFIEENSSWLVPLAAGIAAVVAVQWAWNAAMAANPLTLVVLGIAALIAGIVLLVKNWDKVKGAFLWLFDWLKSHWPLLLVILTGPFGAAVLLITKNWDTIRGAISGVFSFIQGIFGKLTAILTKPFTAAWDAISAVFDKVHGAVDSAFSFVRDTAGKIASALKGPINAVIRAWNGLEFKVPEVHVGPVHFGGQTIGLPDIPELARGGTVARTGLALVHAGEQFSGVGRTFGGQTNITVNVTTTGLGADAPQIQRAVVQALRGFTARNGALDVPVRQAG